MSTLELPFEESSPAIVLFVFAVVSIILNAMQVELAVEQFINPHWVSIWSVCRWFSILTLMGAAVISAWFILLWLWIFLDESVKFADFSQ